MEARLDPEHAAIVNAPPLPDEADPPLPRWMRELIDEMNEACRNPPSAEERERRRLGVPVEHAPVNARKSTRFVRIDGSKNTKAVSAMELMMRIRSSRGSTS